MLEDNSPEADKTQSFSLSSEKPHSSSVKILILEKHKELVSFSSS